MAGSNAVAAFGTTLSRNGHIIAELTSIGGINVQRDTIEVTNHQSPNQYKEYIAGMKDGGELTVSGNFIPGDTNGQIGLLEDLENGTLQSFVITLPPAITATFMFNALVTAFKTDDKPVDGKLGFSATLKISGKPTLNITASNNLSNLTVSGSGTTLVPVFTGSTYVYIVNIAASTNSVTITPTAVAGVITIKANGQVQVVASGQPSSAIILGAAGSVTVATVEVKETGKTAKLYTLYLTRAAV